MTHSIADLEILIKHFRLLELAGAADQIAHQTKGLPEAKWWRDYAQAARTYHSRLSARTLHSDALVRAPESKSEFFARIASELALTALEGRFRSSYFHFLRAYEAMASLEGDRMIRELKVVVEALDPSAENPSLDNVRGFFARLDSTMLTNESISSYDIMQIVADALGPALRLKKHAFEDITRFALQPDFPVVRAE